MSGAVTGFAMPEFASVYDLFHERAGELGPGGAALAVARGKDLLVDLWAGNRVAGQPWRGDTRAVLMSATKGIGAAALATLCDHGFLDPDALVARYWPEFAVNDKQNITIRQVLSHTAGLYTVEAYESVIRPSGDGLLETEEIVRRLAGAQPAWAPGSAIGYHGITIGWLTSELARRVSGRSLGSTFNEFFGEIVDGEVELGTATTSLKKIAFPVLSDEVRRTEEERALSGTVMRSKMGFASSGKSLFTEMERLTRRQDLMQAELAGFNATGTARGLARMYGALASTRAVDPHPISRVVLDAFTQVHSKGQDIVLGDPACWGLGFGLACDPPAKSGGSIWKSASAFGNPGFGGQIGLGDREAGLGIGFVRSYLSETSTLGPDLITAIYDSFRG